MVKMMTPGNSMISLIGYFSLILSGHARLDFSGDGISEIWKLKYSEALVVDGDSDGDGFSNRDEAIAGTDPTDRTDFLHVKSLRRLAEEVEIKWDSRIGKTYRVERWNEFQKNWEDVLEVQPSEFEEEKLIQIPAGAKAIYRLTVSDTDADQDGLTAWEEAQFGWSDGDIRSSGQNGRLDFVAALREIEKIGGAELMSGEQLTQRRPSRAEAARFLRKASFGPTDQLIEDVRSMGFSGWLDVQMDLPVLTTRSAMFMNRITPSANHFRHGWWRVANIAEDQLRHRVAYALSQILVVNMEGGSVIGDNAITQATFYDIFVNGAFGPYRNVLEQVTYSPVMGFYLSHLKNRKSDPSINRFPDENFAREIMQLFTIGLWELYPDGTFKLDSKGKQIPTYDNETITEMARVFTGMSFTTTASGQPSGSFFNMPRGNDYWNPMKVWDEEHEPGPKKIIGNVILDGSQTGEEEVQSTLDALVSHPNIAPFVSRLLIQRMTTSNPSASYLSRVSSAWNFEREGMSGHLGSVIEAILLDPESLGINSDNEYGGKVREPILRFLNIFRAFNFQRPGVDLYAAEYSQLREHLGQAPTMAPTVFNFYLPDFSPAGQFRADGFVSPEMQLATDSQMIQSDTQFNSIIHFGHRFAVPDYTKELVLADDPETLVDRVSLLLTGDTLKVSTKTAILTAVEAAPSPLERVRAAVYLVSQSLECITFE